MNEQLRAIASPKPIFDYLKARGGAVQGECIVISGWPVQFLPPTGPLVEEALRDAVTRDVEGTPARVSLPNTSPPSRCRPAGRLLRAWSPGRGRGKNHLGPDAATAPPFHQAGGASGD